MQPPNIFWYLTAWMLLEYIILESYPCDKYLYDTFFCSISFVIIWAWCFWFFERSMSWRATCYDIIMREEIPLNSNAINMYSILWRMCSSWLQRAFKYVAKAVFWGIKWWIFYLGHDIIFFLERTTLIVRGAIKSHLYFSLHYIISDYYLLISQLMSEKGVLGNSKFSNYLYILQKRLGI